MKQFGKKLLMGMLSVSMVFNNYLAVSSQEDNTDIDSQDPIDQETVLVEEEEIDSSISETDNHTIDLIEETEEPDINEEGTAQYSVIGYFRCDEDNQEIIEPLILDENSVDVSELAMEYDSYSWTGVAYIETNNEDILHVTALADSYCVTDDGFGNSVNVSYSDIAYEGTSEIDVVFSYEKNEPETDLYDSTLKSTLRRSLNSIQNTAITEGIGDVDLTNVANTTAFSVEVRNADLDKIQKRDASFELRFSYSLTSDNVHLLKQIAETRNPVLTYDMNSFIANHPLKDLTDSKTQGNIYDGMTPIGLMDIKNNVVYLTITNIAWMENHVDSLSGTFSFSIATDEDKLGTDNQIIYDFPAVRNPFTVNYEQLTFATSKKVNGNTITDGSKVDVTEENGKYYLNYEASINVPITVNSLLFTDTYGGSQTLDTASIKVNGNTVSGVTTGSGTFSFDVKNTIDPVNQGDYIVSYRTEITEVDLGNLTPETNTASWKINGTKDVPGGETSVRTNPAKTDVSITKVWNDGGNSDGYRPSLDSFRGKIHLMNGANEVYGYSPIIIDNGDNTFSITYTGLSTKDNDGNTITYTVKEDEIDGYTPGGSDPIPAGGTLTNTHAPHEPKSVTVTKNWVGDSSAAGARPTPDEMKAHIQLLGNWNVVEGYTPVITDNGNNTYTISYTNLPAAINGVEQQYYIKEIPVEGYNSDHDTSNTEITNTYDGKTSISISKIWDDGNNLDGSRPGTNTFKSSIHLMNGDQEVTGYEPEITGSGNTYLISFKDLPLADSAGNKIHYTIKEDPIEGYTADITTASDGQKITNTHEPADFKVTKTVENETSGEGEWKPGDMLSYTVTFGGHDVLMDGVVLQDYMTDLQTVEGSITVTLPNGNQFELGWEDDRQYRINDTEVFTYTVPAGTGKGVVRVTYKTKIIDETTANQNNIFGLKYVKNHAEAQGKGKSAEVGKNTDFGDIPMEKTVSPEDTGSGWTPGQVLQYTLSYGNEYTPLDGLYIYDEMTQLQKLTSDITITFANGTSAKMPTASGAWAQDGVVWNLRREGTPNTYYDSACAVFNYQFPEKSGNGPVTIAYTTQIISADEAKTSGIQGTKTIKNTFTVNNVSRTTEGTVTYENPSHIPSVGKKAADTQSKLSENIVTWEISIDKKEESAFPLSKVVVFENSYNCSDSDRTGSLTPDLIHARIITQSGKELQAGKDYEIVTDNAYKTPIDSKPYFYFETIDEPLTIYLDTVSSIDISDQFTAYNQAGSFYYGPYGWNYHQFPDYTYQYTSGDISVSKTGSYDPDTKIIEWTVSINPTKKQISDDPDHVYFSDTLPNGVVLLNYSDGTINNPSIVVNYSGNYYIGDTVFNANGVNGSENCGGDAEDYHKHKLAYNTRTNTISGLDISLHSVYGNPDLFTRLSGQRYDIKYKTLVTEDKWKEITSSPDGSLDLINTVLISDDKNHSWSKTKSINIEATEFITKRALLTY